MTDRINNFSSGALAAKMQERSSTLNKKEAELAIARVFDGIDQLLREGEKRVRVANFGNFQRVYRDGRRGRNPATGEQIDIAGREVVKFKPGKNL